MRHTIQAGLIGCGDVATRYALALAGTDRLGIKLGYITDVSEESGRAFAERWGVKFIPTVNELLNQQVELICICTPNATHAALAEQCLLAGLHVLLEHPMATNLQDAQRLHRTATTSGRQLFVVRQRRYHSTIQLLRAALAAGVFGRILSVEATMCWNRRPSYFTDKPWRSEGENGGVVLNQASHFFDILLHLFGTPQSVNACIGNVRHAMQSEDSAFGQIHFPEVSAKFQMSVAAPEGWNRTSLRIHGRKNSIELGGSGWELFEGLVPDELLRLDNQVEQPATGDHDGYFQRIARRLRGETVQVVDSVEGLRTATLIDMLYDSAIKDDTKARTHFEYLFAGAQP